MEVAMGVASEAANRAHDVASHAASNAAHWADVYVTPFSDNMLPIIAATLFWFLHMRLSGSISHRLSESYRKLSDAEKVDWCVRTCAITHACFALGTVPHWLSPPASYLEDHMYAPMTDRDRLVLCFTVGYFIWDICVCLWYSWGAFFTTHAFASFGVFYSGLYPSGAYYLGFFLGVFEISTPYFHLRELLSLAKKDNHWFFHAVSITFAVSFTLVRVVGGCWVSYNWWCDTMSVLISGRAHSVPVYLFCYLANIILMSLQMIWFVKMVRAVLGEPIDSSKKST